MAMLLSVTALLEAMTGLALLIAPALIVSLLFGAALDTSSEIAVAHVAGAALLSIGVASWLARNDLRSRAARGLILALLLYNAMVAAVLVHAHFALGLSGIALWPVVVVHAALAGWCIFAAAKSEA
jgi:hypothetical protein